MDNRYPSSAPTGAVCLDGQLLEPPYKLTIGDRSILINDLRYESPEGTEMAMRQFAALVDSVRRADPKAEYVRRFEGAMAYDIRSDPSAEVIEGSPLMDQLRSISWASEDIRAGRVIVRGQGYDVRIAAADRTAFLEALESTLRSGTVPPDAVKTWPVFANAQFCKDLKAKARRKIE